MEKEEGFLEACSGCAGDYEDPDRTAWEELEEEALEGLAQELEDEPC